MFKQRLLEYFSMQSEVIFWTHVYYYYISRFQMCAHIPAELLAKLVW